jgi:hypothetical protein
METIKLKAHIGSDGLLKLETPLHVTDADVEVIIIYTIQPASKQDD